MDNPWGSSADDEDVGFALPPLSSSSAAGVPSLTTATDAFSSGGNGWTDDPGWGTAHDDTGVAMLSSRGPSAAMTTSDSHTGDGGLGTGESYTSPSPFMARQDSFGASTGANRGWTADDSPELPRPTSPPSFSPALDGTAHVESTAFESDHHAGAMTDAASESDSAGGWAPVGSPVLPPISSLSVNDDIDVDGAGAALASTRIDAWQPEQEWSPPEVPEPLPTFGDAFDKARRRPSVASSEDGWGAGTAHAMSQSWTENPDTVREEERFTQEEEEDASELEQGRHTPMTAEYEQRQSREEVAERQDDRVQQQKQNAESETDKPAAKPARTWWRRGGSNVTEVAATAATQETASSAPKLEPIATATSSEQAATAAPSAFGRLIGRFKRQSAASDTASGQGSARNSIEEQQAPSNSVAAEWKPKDLDALEAVSKRSEPVFAVPSMTRPTVRNIHDTNDDDDVELYDTRKSARRQNSAPKQIPTYEPEDDFGGLIGAFSQAPTRAPVSSRTKVTKSLDPFDPFADDDDDDNRVNSNPVVRQQVATPSRPLGSGFTAASVPLPTGRVAAFPSSFAAPQARGVSTVVPAAGPVTDVDDSFDAFFDSVAASTQRTRTPVVAPPGPVSQAGMQSRPNASIPRFNAPPASPVRPSASKSQSPLHALPRMSPPPKSSSPIAPLAPPPPPAQPVTRVSPVPRFDTTTPPSSNGAQTKTGAKTMTALPPELLAAMSKPLVASRPPTLAVSGTNQPPGPTPPSATGGSSLSKDDFDFFES
ncbi:hypothetical protein OIV83_000618 [Microbotryomycetes sp. JL201]|nr:hypothetical protein OIV83_000618 [Microbotryomycetes sp. JL201]